MKIKQNSLIISCQAVEGEILHGYGIMHLMAKAAVYGGADGIRANSVSDINDIQKTVDVPVIGIIKAVYPGSDVYITPTMKELKALLEGTKVDVIALDATFRTRPGGDQLADLVRYARENYPQVELMADCATYEEAQNADRMGFDYVGTTLRGYTADTKGIAIPDTELLKQMTSTLKAKVIAEGGIWEVGQLREVLKTGVHAVVIGSSVTRPADITKRFKKEFEVLK